MANYSMFSKIPRLKTLSYITRLIKSFLSELLYFSLFFKVSHFEIMCVSIKLFEIVVSGALGVSLKKRVGET